MAHDYYSLPYDDPNIEKSFLQWNCYLIVPNEYFTTSEQFDNFLENDKYTRKYVMRREEINSFIEEK